MCGGGSESVCDSVAVGVGVGSGSGGVVMVVAVDGGGVVVVVVGDCGVVALRAKKYINGNGKCAFINMKFIRPRPRRVHCKKQNKVAKFNKALP